MYHYIVSYEVFWSQIFISSQILLLLLLQSVTMKFMSNLKLNIFIVYVNIFSYKISVRLKYNELKYNYTVNNFIFSINSIKIWTNTHY
jgi:hypothetical protein